MANFRSKMIWAGLGLVFLASLYLVIVLGIWFSYSGKIRPGVTIAGVSYAGQGDKEILVHLQERADRYLAGGNKYKIEYDFDQTLAEAKEAISNPLELGKRRDISLSFEYNQDVLNRDLRSYQKKANRQVSNPVIVKRGGELLVRPGEYGSRVLYGENVHRFETMVGGLESGFRPLAVRIGPSHTLQELKSSLDLAKGMALKGLTLAYGSRKYIVPEEEIASWLSVRPQGSPLSSRLTGGFLAALASSDSVSGLFDAQRIGSYLATVAKKIDRDPINATLRMEEGKVAVFALSREGLSLNIDESTIKIMESLEAGDVKAALVVERMEPEITQNSLASLGIIELIAEGRSNFAGSPVNRRHNIRVGASKFDGIIIKPGETFSFTGNLGPVDAGTGYLPELVIKDNETVPEFGGGLCQVSSTVFRAALNAGLPIVARRPHAYPVPYYKPFGTDATIYIPNPDLKFTNDTGHHILIQTTIRGNYLYFYFYGTKKPGQVRFAGNEKGTGTVRRVEDVKPSIYDQGLRGEGSFTAVFWQFFYDKSGRLIGSDDFVSKYDSPLKYPH